MKIKLELNEEEIRQAIKEYIYSHNRLDHNKVAEKKIISSIVIRSEENSFSADVILEEEPFRYTEL